MKDEFLKEVLEKFAVSGAMYSRALGNAAQRSGGRIAPKVLDQIAAQPRAKRISENPKWLSNTARSPFGEMPKSPHHQELNDSFASLPRGDFADYHDEGARHSVPGSPAFMVPEQFAANDAFEAKLRETGRQKGVASNRYREKSLEQNRQYQLGAATKTSPGIGYDKTQLNSGFDPTLLSRLSEKTTPGTAMARRKTAVDGNKIVSLGIGAAMAAAKYLR